MNKFYSKLARFIRNNRIIMIGYFTSLLFVTCAFWYGNFTFFNEDVKLTNSAESESIIKEKVPIAYANEKIEIETEIEAPPKAPRKLDVSILAAGDVMCHTPQLAAQMINGKYDFSNNFDPVSEIVKKEDIRIVNLETVLAGSKYKYDGYPKFNTPDEMLDAIVDSGFNVVNFCNNHILDMTSEGLLRTISVLEEKNVPYIGVRKSPTDKRYHMFKANDVNVAIAGYTYEIPYGNSPTLNGNIIPSETHELINFFGYGEEDQGIKQMGELVDEMKADGADVVVFYLHWGNEYEKKANSHQIRIAEFLASKGVDVIFGSHPHVIQNMEQIDDTVVFYSLGNFLSNQRFEAMGRRDTEDGLIAITDFIKDEETGDTTYKGSRCVPTWLNKYYVTEKGRYVYEIMPLNRDLDSTKSEELFGTNLWRARNSFNITKMLIDDTSIKNLVIEDNIIE